MLDEEAVLLVVLLDELDPLLVLEADDEPEEVAVVLVVADADVEPVVEDPEVLVSEDKDVGGVEVCVAVEPVVRELADPDDAIENMGL